MLQVMSLSHQEREEMGQAGRSHVVQNFEMERIVERWETLYRELLMRKGIGLQNAE